MVWVPAPKALVANEAEAVDDPLAVRVWVARRLAPSVNWMNAWRECRCLRLCC